MCTLPSSTDVHLPCSIFVYVLYLYACVHSGLHMLLCLFGCEHSGLWLLRHSQSTLWGEISSISSFMWCGTVVGLGSEGLSHHGPRNICHHCFSLDPLDRDFCNAARANTHLCPTPFFVYTERINNDITLHQCFKQAGGVTYNTAESESRLTALTFDWCFMFALSYPVNNNHLMSLLCGGWSRPLLSSSWSCVACYNINFHQYFCINNLDSFTAHLWQLLTAVICRLYT